VGTFAREPDLKWKTTESSVQKLVGTQRALLERAVTEGRRGAVVVYATCSLLREENEDQVDWVRSRHPGVRVEDASGWLPPEVCQGGFLRAWPHRVAGGGFFAARLRLPD
jgi:16S rRNA (cytosine967-C5)-methyltransferase